MSRLTEFRDHCRQMATAEHKPECPSLTAKEPYWPPGGWAPVDKNGNWTRGSGEIHGLGWIGRKPKWEPPHCDGCVTDAERDLFARMADEVDDYLEPQVDLFGNETSEPDIARSDA